MKTISSGEIVEGGLSVFKALAGLDDDNNLVMIFEGAIRVDDPRQYLSSFLDELARALPPLSSTHTVMDFAKLRFCNDHGVPVLTEIADRVYDLVSGGVTVRRLASDDWQWETLPIVLSLSVESHAQRTSFEDVR